jgi:ceramide glucosyltransferase
MSDADISVETDHLRRVAGELAADDKIGIVTCAYRGNPDKSLGSRLEAAYVNTDILPQLLISNAIEPMRHAMGATIAIRREALDSIGGFAAVKNMLADDFMIGKLAADRGWKIVLSNSLVTLNCEESTFTDFWSHQLRWARTYRTFRPVSLATIAIHGPFWALMLILSSGFSVGSLCAGALVAGARIAMAAIVYSRVVNLPELIRDAWLVPLKDLAITGIWFASLLSNRVTWAGRRLEILKNGEMREVATGAARDA